jgi:hypothetical protein
MTVPARRDEVDLGVLDGQFTEVSYTPNPNTPFDAWLDICAAFGRMHRSAQWWIGDSILWGERKYGEVYAAAEEVTGLEPGTLANIVSVCRYVESSRRRELLSFSHHAVVAYLPKRDADRLLKAAERNGWSISALRAAKRQLADGDDPTATAEVEVVQPELIGVRPRTEADSLRPELDSVVRSLRTIRRDVSFLTAADLARLTEARDLLLEIETTIAERKGTG